MSDYLTACQSRYGPHYKAFLMPDPTDQCCYSNFKQLLDPVLSKPVYSESFNLIANHMSDFFDGSNLVNPIYTGTNTGSCKAGQAGAAYIWTGFYADGSDSSYTCFGWSSSVASGAAFAYAYVTANWNQNNISPCNTGYAAFYCVAECYQRGTDPPSCVFNQP
jgi:hypothetical protein